MQHPTVEVPFTDDERLQLKLFYKKLFSGALALAIMAVIPFSALFLRTHGDTFTLIMRTIIFGIGFTYILYTKVIPLKRDLIKGCKDNISYQIVRREYFPYTHEYYFALDDTRVLHYQVDAETYHKYQQGDYISICSTKHSKYVLSSDGKFILSVF